MRTARSQGCSRFLHGHHGKTRSHLWEEEDLGGTGEGAAGELSLGHAELGLEIQGFRAEPGLEGGCSAGASGKVDPVYETLRYGTSLALMNRSSFSSTSESPTRSLVWWAKRGVFCGGVSEHDSGLGG